MGKGTVINYASRGSRITDTWNNCSTGILLVHYYSSNNVDCSLLVVDKQASDCMSGV